MVDPIRARFILVGMKLGLISDVHGDLRALLRAQELLLGRHQVDGIWCAGDLVGRGNHPDEVVQHIVGGGIPAVLGNHDELMISPWRGSMLGQLLGFGSQTLRLLATLPRTYRAHLDQRTLVMVHGSPRSNSEAISINPNQRQLALAWLDKAGADILITGHTHTPMLLESAHGIIINPGSLYNADGLDRASSETYGVLDLRLLQFHYYPLWD